MKPGRIGYSTTTRRRAIAGISALALSPACTLTARNESQAAQPFAHGIASGDPGPTSVVIWTRANPLFSPRSLTWVISESADFRASVASGRIGVGPERDFTAKVLVEGLAPGRSYFYRFSSSAGDSPVGRTRTLPRGHRESLKLAVVSCSNYPFGHFNAYDAIGGDPEVEFVLHLGDYIYEYAANGWGSDVGAEIGRIHEPMHEIVSLADYRLRHAQYKSDPGSRRMHAAHPLIPIWDDHETTNNPWMGGAQNHQPATEGPWQARRDASLRAYYEWMPIREQGAGVDRANYWRHYEFGDLASLITLETRHTGRSRQVGYDQHISDLISESAARQFRDNVLGDDSRTMLSAEMSAFLSQSLRQTVTAGRSWKILGNQTPMARLNVPQQMAEVIGASLNSNTSLSAELLRLEIQGLYNLPIFLDAWDGYGAARERLYALSAAAGVRDLLVVTGDSHAFWLNELHTAQKQKIGLEIGTAGVSSPGVFEEFGDEASAALDTLMAQHNPEVLWTDNTSRGYVTLSLRHEAADIGYMGVSNVASADYDLYEIRRETVVRSNGSLVVDSVRQ